MELEGCKHSATQKDIKHENNFSIIFLINFDAFTLQHLLSRTLLDAV